MIGWISIMYHSKALIILHEIYMIIVTHPTTFVHCFRVLFLSGTHCKGVSKQLCVYHLYRNVFLAQTRIRSHLGCIFLFRNSFLYPQSNRDSKRVSKRLSRVVAFIIDFSVSRVRVTSHEEGFVTAELHYYHLYRSVFLAQTRIRSPFFPRFRKAFLTP